MTAKLRLDSITCLGQSEFGQDELYVTFNGKKKSLPPISQGQTELLSNEFLFDGSSKLSLFENDGDHWYDRDDFIDSHMITESPADLTLDFKATSGHALGSHYQLRVRINLEIHQTAVLKLRSITCLGQSEFGHDELYVTFNGTKKSLPPMSQGQIELLSDEFLFDGSPKLSLFENDGDHWYDRDDFIGSHMITESPVDLTLDFKATSGHASGSHYLLDVSITQGP